MASVDANVSMPKIMRSVTLRVNLRGVKSWRLRLWVGTRLLKLAALVIGCGIRFDGTEASRESVL